jgi:Domain of unknown function (DUF427)
LRDGTHIRQRAVRRPARGPLHFHSRPADGLRPLLQAGAVPPARLCAGEAVFDTLAAEEDLRHDLLEPSDRRTRCPHKGLATYWHLRVGDTLHEDLAWTYADPDREGSGIRGLICFFDERVDLDVDGKTQERPVTQWSH